MPILDFLPIYYLKRLIGSTIEVSLAVLFCFGNEMSPKTLPSLIFVQRTAERPIGRGINQKD